MRYDFHHDYNVDFFDYNTPSSIAFIESTQHDFVWNLHRFLRDEWGVPGSTSFSIARCLLHRMGDDALHMHTPVRTLSLLQNSQEIQESDDVKNWHLGKHGELAVWFLDAIFIPGAAPVINEAQSRDFLLSQMDYWMSPSDKQEVSKLILATAYHTNKEILHTPLTTAFRILDLDLAYLAWADPGFRTAEMCVEMEFNHLKTNEYRNARVTYFKELMLKGFVFRTDYFRTNYQQQAFDNMERMIKRI